MRRDIKQKTVLKVFESYGFFVTVNREHMKLENADGRKISALPNHKLIKGSTLMEILRRAGIDKNEFFGRC